MHAEESIKIQAPIEIVWQTLTEIDQWPHWQAAVSEASLQGSLTPSTEFLWVSGGMKIRSQLTKVAAPSSVNWIGQALGTQADHAWSLQANDAGTTVTTTESMSGWLVSLFGTFNKDFLSKSLRQTLTDLKAEAERRHAV